MRTDFTKLTGLILICTVLAIAGCGNYLEEVATAMPGNQLAIIASPAAQPAGLSLPPLPETSGSRAVSDCNFTPLKQFGNASYATAPTAVPDPVQQKLLLSAPAGNACWTMH